MAKKMKRVKQRKQEMALFWVLDGFFVGSLEFLIMVDPASIFYDFVK